jgi:TM2 domain-containing membrane protein YozV
MADAESKPHFRHISDIEVWLTPDRNYFMFILLSVFTGFFALDHIYLRSFDTAFQKFFYNLLGLGIWYWWDLIQIFTEGPRVQKEGLTSPFDWTQGIGRGVFNFSDSPAKFAPEKSYIIWAFLAIFGGFFALDKFYLGDYMHAFTKLLTVFFPFFTLFGVIWVGWDAFHALFMTKEVVSGTISLPIPLGWFGYNETNGRIFLPSQPKQAGESMIARMIKGTSPEKVFNIAALMGVPELTKTVGGLIGRVKEVQSKVQDAPVAAKAAVSTVKLPTHDIAAAAAAAADAAPLPTSA